METPTASGTARLRPIHTPRTTPAGTQLGMGTKASTNAANRGAAIPMSSSGQAPAAASSPERKIF
jgi:hypothetical protein